VKIVKKPYIHDTGKKADFLILTTGAINRLQGTQCQCGGRGPAGQLPEELTYREVLRRDWNNRVYGASKFSFPHSKEFL
jgi:hypothetical protein